MARRGYESSDRQVGDLTPPPGVTAANPRYPAGTVWPWNSMLEPPEDWDFVPNSKVYAFACPLPIVAVRDTDVPPSLTAKQVEYLRSHRMLGVERSRQSRLAAGKR
jgi:hypothetical protein